MGFILEGQWIFSVEFLTFTEAFLALQMSVRLFFLPHVSPLTASAQTKIDPLKGK